MRTNSPPKTKVYYFHPVLTTEIDSLSKKFSVFLQTSQRYASLDSSNQNQKQIILIQDLPNTIGSSNLISQARHIFQTSLKQFLASSRVRYPVILIITESEIGSGEDFGYASNHRESLTVKSLLGDDILTNPATTHISYSHHVKS
jgi:cell cycle checkpoint protein